MTKKFKRLKKKVELSFWKQKLLEILR